MLISHTQIQFFLRRFHVKSILKNYVKLEENERKLCAPLSHLLGVTYVKVNKLIANNKDILSVAEDDLKKTVLFLQSLKFTSDDILRTPKILCTNSLTLENRYQVLKESGCAKISLNTICKYIIVVNSNLVKLKSYGIIPYETDVQKILEEFFEDVRVALPQRQGENITLKHLRSLVLEKYLEKKLEADKTQLNKLMKTYERMKHKSFTSIVEMIDLLLNDLNFPKDRIIKNGYLIHGDPKNTRRIIYEIRTLGNEDFREILYRRPKILMSSCDSLLEILRSIKEYKIPESAVLKCLDILTLGPDTVRKRLEDLNDIEEFNVLKTNPRILRIVHYQNKARLRLNYLNQLKVRCASLNILSCESEAFEKFTRDGPDKTKGKDLIIYLVNVFKKSELEIREQFSRHPHWCHTPLTEIRSRFDYLVSKGFSSSTIYESCHLLLYSIELIEEKLNDIRENKLEGKLKAPISYFDMPKNKILALCQYLIELEFHFTGDGIWTNHHVQQVDYSMNTLPDLPENISLKSYKFGVKPSKEKLEQLSKVI